MYDRGYLWKIIASAIFNIETLLKSGLRWWSAVRAHCQGCTWGYSHCNKIRERSKSQKWWGGENMIKTYLTLKMLLNNNSIITESKKWKCLCSELVLFPLCFWSYWNWQVHKVSLRKHSGFCVVLTDSRVPWNDAIAMKRFCTVDDSKSSPAHLIIEWVSNVHKENQRRARWWWRMP